MRQKLNDAKLSQKFSHRKSRLATFNNDFGFGWVDGELKEFF
jgi:hypothetical protein